MGYLKQYVMSDHINSLVGLQKWESKTVKVNSDSHKQTKGLFFNNEAGNGLAVNQNYTDPNGK